MQVISARASYAFVPSFLFIAQGYSIVWLGHNLLSIHPLIDIRAVSGSKTLPEHRHTRSFTSGLRFRSNGTAEWLQERDTTHEA